MPVMYNYTNSTVQDMSDQIKWTAFLNKRSLADKIILIVFAICATVGNILVLTVTWREAKLHQPNKYFVACLAVADLLVGLIVCPVKAYVYHFEDELLLNTGSIHLCRFTAWTDTFALVASIFTLTFISIDRFIKIKKPLQYKSTMTTSRSLKIIFIIWLISTISATHAAIPESGSNYGPVCSTTDSDKIKRYFTFVAITAFFLPTAVILVMYTLIFIVAHKRQKMLRNGEFGQTGADRSQRSAFLQSLKTIRMLTFVAGVFMLCWGPFAISLLLQLYYPDIIYSNSSSFSYRCRILIVNQVIHLLPYSNSLYNPIIYAWLDQTYRAAFKNLFQKLLCRPRRSSPPVGIELQSIRAIR